ncbi:MAG: YraN family protein [Candidatus Pacebacteria bacterium]|nr:YraN family protein [Candidatus Paceibacterota bacterium]
MQNQRQKIGQVGEDIATNYLKKEGYQILERNFKTKWGELDIIAKKKGVLIFVEVKTLRSELRRTAQGRPFAKSEFLPEDEITFHKTKQLQKMAQIYLSFKKLPLDIDQQIDVVAIIFNTLSDYIVRHTKNAIGDY